MLFPLEFLVINFFGGKEYEMNFCWHKWIWEAPNKVVRVNVWSTIHYRYRCVKCNNVIYREIYQPTNFIGVNLARRIESQKNL